MFRHDMITLAEAAAALAMTRNALYLRVLRARKRGEDTPFVRVGTVGRGELYAELEAVLAWAKTWTGKRKIR